MEIPLTNQGFDDFIAWNFNRNRRYSVKSGYHLQWKFSFGARAGQLALPGSSATNPVWKVVWGLKLPSKIKKILWRALHGVIPLKSILVNRHIGTSGQCPICMQEAEDVKHLLFRFATAMELWSSLGIANTIEEAQLIDRSGSAILEHLLRDEENKFSGFDNIGQNEVIGVACWYLWWIRRRRTHEESVPPMLRCKMSILSIVSNASKVGSKPADRPRWEKPNSAQTKVNVDGSFHQDTHAGSVAAVIRDSKGNFLAASTTFLPSVALAAMAEAMAMREGLALANRLGCNNVIMESDSTETVEAFSGEDVWWGDSSAIFADCVDLASLIDKISFKFSPREANGVAHELARNSYETNSTCNWADEPPSFILSFLLNDVTII
jgi:ribonuclease HI